MANDPKATGFEGDVAQAFANQVAYCRKNDAPLTASVVEGVAALMNKPDPGPFVERIREWRGEPLADGLPLRAAAAFHGLHLSGRVPALASIYAGPGTRDADLLGGIAREYADDLLPWLDGPPQTNEAGRSANFVAAMLWLADQGLPARFACLEIGSSAGINLMLDRYQYVLGGVKVGPQPSAMTLSPEWRGPPPPGHALEIVSAKGCDVAPVDLADPLHALRLRSYVWPEHTARFVRLEAAIAAAKLRPPDLIKANAAQFVEAQLALPQDAGTTRILMHSIVWQYVPADQQSRVIASMEAAGLKATADRPLAWVQVEADRTLLNHGVRVRYWPGGEAETLIAAAHAHGAWIEWLVADRPTP